MSWRSVLLVAGLLWCGGSRSNGQRLELEFQDQTRSELVQVFLTVTGSRGRFVDGLRLTDFILEDSGIEQRIVTFATGDVPYAALLVVDASLSMSGESAGLAERAATAFLGTLGEFDEGGWLAFADRPLHFDGFGGASPSKIATLHDLRPSGGTALFDALFAASVLLEARLGHRAVILVSDGEDLHSSSTIADVERALGVSRAQLFWIRPRSSEIGARAPMPSSWYTPSQARENLVRLDDLVRRTGGRSFDVTSYAGVTRALDGIRDVLRNQVALGYVPDPPLGSGRFRHWNVRLRNPAPGSDVRAADGFFDVGPSEAAGAEVVPER